MQFITIGTIGKGSVELKAGCVREMRVITLKDARMGRHILSINARGELAAFIKIGKIIR